MRREYPTPSEAGISIPPLVREQLCNAGFRHGLKGGSLDRAEYLRFSFRMGVRAAKLYLRHVRRARDIIDFPQRWKIRVSADFEPDEPARDES